MAKSKAWWLEAKGEAHTLAVKTMQALDDAQENHAERSLQSVRLYSNRHAVTRGGVDWQSYDLEDPHAMQLNLIQTVVDTLVSHLGTSRIRNYPLTTEGNWTQKRRAKRLGLWLDGVFRENGQPEISRDVLYESLLVGTGWELVTCKNGRPHMEFVSDFEIILDELEGRSGLHQIMRHKIVDADWMAMQHPGNDDIFTGAKDLRSERVGGYRHRSHTTIENPISLVEAWQLPTDPDKKNGRHLVFTSKGTMVDDAYDSDKLPLVPLRWKKPPCGFGYRGISLAEELVPLQEDINFMTERIQEIMTLNTGETWAQEGSVQDDAWTNDPGTVREYSGNQPPIKVAVDMVPKEYWMQISTTWDRGFQMAGLSQLAANATKPSGLQSGEALKTLNDTQSARYLDKQQAFEEFHVAVADRVITEAEALQESGEAADVLAISGNAAHRIDFSDVQIDRRDYALAIYPTSMLPKEPAGKLDTIERWGQIDPNIQRQLVRLMDYPDIEDAVRQVSAPEDMLAMAVELSIDRGEVVIPESVWPLDLFVRELPRHILRAQLDGVREDRIQLLRDLLDSVIGLQTDAMQPQGPAAMPQQAPGPMAQPAPGTDLEQLTAQAAPM